MLKSDHLQGPLAYVERIAIMRRKTLGSAVASSFGPMRTSDPET